VPPWQSGLIAPADVTGLAIVKTVGGSVLIVANSGDSLQAFTMGRR